MSPDALAHPRLGCQCSEGRVVSDGRGDVRFLPSVHSCAYIRLRNGQIAEAERRASRDVERSSPGLDESVHAPHVGPDGRRAARRVGARGPRGHVVVIPFGKHQGLPLSAVPSLQWLANLGDLRAPLKGAVVAELRERGGATQLPLLRCPDPALAQELVAAGRRSLASSIRTSADGTRISSASARCPSGSRT